MPEIIDDKSQHCIPYLLERLRIHTERHSGNTPPFFIGLNGVQGAGKTVLVCQPYTPWMPRYISYLLGKRN
jgi:D-glycerate 3-kinase